MSFLTEINCTTVLEAIKKEKAQRKTEFDNQSNNEYVNVNPHEVAFWTDLFANCFLCYDQNDAIKNSLVHDDMLFFVSKLENLQNKIEVYRRDSKRLPCLTDFNYDWEETVYLNLLLHELEYTLTCAICTQTGTKDLEILKRHSKRVFASPSKRDLQSKGVEEEITYPNIYFTIDDFDSAFNDMIVNEGEMVCVELVADDGKFRKVLFLGSIKYESLKKVYDARASTSSKLVQKVSFGSFEQKRIEFVRMKGPGGKGYAEMAVSKHLNDTASNMTSPTVSMPSTPNEEQFRNDPFSSFWKISNTLRKKSFSQAPSVASSVVGTPELEARDIRQDMIDSSNKNSFWDRTFGNTFSTFFTKPNPQEKDNYFENATPNNAVKSKIPLNAYLTYVTLKLQLIMQDVLETKQKSLLTF